MEGRHSLLPSTSEVDPGCSQAMECFVVGRPGNQGLLGHWLLSVPGSHAAAPPKAPEGAELRQVEESTVGDGGPLGGVFPADLARETAFVSGGGGAGGCYRGGWEGAGEPWEGPALLPSSWIPAFG